MIHSKDNLVGIDKVIDKIQKLLYDPLSAKGMLNIYGRADRFLKDNKTHLKVYTQNGEYIDVMYSEGNKVFFIEGSSPTKNQGRTENDLWVVCIFNVDSSGKRQDEELHQEVETLLNRKYMDELTGSAYGMDELRKVSENSIYGNFKYGDIHPYHVFMVRMRVKYYLIQNSPCSC